MLGGAVGIENTTGWNFKDLERMLGKAKALKRNNGECKEILIGPSFFLPLRFLRGGFSPITLHTELASGPNLAADGSQRSQIRTQSATYGTAPLSRR